MIETEADRLAILRDLGEAVRVNDCEIFGVFDTEYLEALDGPGIATSSPVVTCRTSDVLKVRSGNTVVRDGVSYIIREIEPDGTGMTILRLRNYGS